MCSGVEGGGQGAVRHRRMRAAREDWSERCEVASRGASGEEKQSVIVSHAAAHVNDADLHVLRGCSDNMAPTWRRYGPTWPRQCPTLRRHASDTPRRVLRGWRSRTRLAASHSTTSVARQA